MTVRRGSFDDRMLWTLDSRQCASHSSKNRTLQRTELDWMLESRVARVDMATTSKADESYSKKDDSVVIGVIASLLDDE